MESKNFVLEVINGVQKGQTFNLEADKLTIGRKIAPKERKRDWILIEDPSLARIHAFLEWDSEKGLYKAILKAANKNLVINGESVKEGYLYHSDKLQLADVIFRIWDGKPDKSFVEENNTIQKSEPVFERSNSGDINPPENIQDIRIKSLVRGVDNFELKEKMPAENIKERTRTFGASTNEVSEVKPFSFFNKTSDKQQEEASFKKDRKPKVFGNVNSEDKRDESAFKPISLTSNRDNSFVKQSVSSNESKFNSNFKPINLTSSTFSSQNTSKEVPKANDVSERKYPSFDEKTLPKREEKFSRVRSREDRIEAFAEKKNKEVQDEQNFEQINQPSVVPQDLDVKIPKELEEDGQSQFSSKVPQRFLVENRFMSALNSVDSSEIGIVRARENDRRNRRNNLQDNIEEDTEQVPPLQITKNPSLDDTESEPFEAMVNNKSFTSNKHNNNFVDGFSAKFDDPKSTSNKHNDFIDDFSAKFDEAMPTSNKHNDFIDDFSAKFDEAITTSNNHSNFFDGFLSKYDEDVPTSNKHNNFFDDFSEQDEKNLNPFNNIQSGPFFEDNNSRNENNSRNGNNARSGNNARNENNARNLVMSNYQKFVTNSNIPYSDIASQQRRIANFNSKHKLSSKIPEKLQLITAKKKEETANLDNSQQTNVKQTPSSNIKQNQNINIPEPKPLLNVDSGINPVSEVFPNSESLPFAKEEDKALDVSIFGNRIKSNSTESKESNKFSLPLFKRDAEKEDEDFPKSPFFIDDSNAKNENNLKPLEEIKPSSNNDVNSVFEKVPKSVSDIDSFSMNKKRDDRSAFDKPERPSGLLDPSDFSDSSFISNSFKEELENIIPVKLQSTIVSEAQEEDLASKNTVPLVIYSKNQSEGLMVDSLDIESNDIFAQNKEKKQSFDPFSSLIVDSSENKKIDSEIKQPKTPSLSDDPFSSLIVDSPENKRVDSEMKQPVSPSLSDDPFSSLLADSPENKRVDSEIKQPVSPSLSDDPFSSLLADSPENKKVDSEFKQPVSPFDIDPASNKIKPESKQSVSPFSVDLADNKLVPEFKQSVSPFDIDPANNKVKSESKQLVSPFSVDLTDNKLVPEFKQSVSPFDIEAIENKINSEMKQPFVSPFSIDLTENKINEPAIKQPMIPSLPFEDLKTDRVDDIFKQPIVENNANSDKHKKFSKMRFSGADVVQKPILSSAGFTNAVDSDIKTSDSDMEKFLEMIEQNREENQNSQRLNSENKSDKASKTNFFGPASSIDLSFSDYKMKEKQDKVDAKNKKSNKSADKDKKKEEFKEEPRKSKKLVTSVSLPPLKDFISTDKKESKVEEKKKDKPKKSSSAFAFEDLFVEQPEEPKKEEKKTSSYYDDYDYQSPSKKKSDDSAEEIIPEKSVLSMFLESKEKPSEEKVNSEGDFEKDWTIKFVKMPGIGMKDTFDLDRDEIIIGRGSSCDLSLKDMTLADRHVKLYMLEGELYLQKLDRKKQIFINGNPLISSASRVLKIGDRIQLSDMTVFEIQKR